MQPRARIRSRGSGHRRRISGIRISRTSVYETIEEEMSVINTPVLDRFPDTVKAPLSPVIDDNVIVVDPDDTSTDWDERGIAALRRYFTLKDEADVTISESKQAWLDTPFSIYAVQCASPYQIDGGFPLTKSQLSNHLLIVPACALSLSTRDRLMGPSPLSSAVSAHVPAPDRPLIHSHSEQSRYLYLPQPSALTSP